MPNTETTTVIGSTITINGEFASKENVSVLGTIKGQVNTTADIFVEEGGTIEAEIFTRNVDVRGTIVGNVTASDRFEIHSGGSVTGDVRAPRVILADGGKYKGNIDMQESHGKLAEPGTTSQIQKAGRARA